MLKGEMYSTISNRVQSYPFLSPHFATLIPPTLAQALERRVARWEDLRSDFMRAAAGELTHDPFRVGEGMGIIRTPIDCCFFYDNDSPMSNHLLPAVVFHILCYPDPGLLPFRSQIRAVNECGT